MFMAGQQLNSESIPSREKIRHSQEFIVCGQEAQFCMRGIPKNTYCRECAENYFQMLEYLDKIGK
jgi:hypothetical protein